MKETPEEGEGLISREKTTRPSGLPGITTSCADKRRGSLKDESSTTLLEPGAADEDLEEFAEINLDSQQRRHSPCSLTRLKFFALIPSLRSFINAAIFFLLGVALACGLGLGVPYSSLQRIFHSAQGYSNLTDAFGVPSDLVVVPTTQLINRTELDLDTGFVASRTPTIRSYELNITWGLAAPDGIWKPMLLANGQSPGPLLEANAGDTLRVHVNNLLPNTTTSLHFHGLNQYNSTWMDGVAGVSQCGIPAAGGSWTYEFQVTDQRGTFWWHAHAGVQFTDGLYGPIVVHDPNELVPFADGGERILFLGENYHSLGAELAEHYLSPTSPWDPKEAGVEPLSDNLLLNGQNLYNCSVVSTTFNSSSTHHLRARGAQPDCTGGQAYTTTIKPNTTLRLRLINHSSYLSYWFSIDSHNLTIVEMDGVEIEPMTASGVHVNIGQRYSVLITADQVAGEYIIRSTLERECFLPFSTYTSAGLESIGHEARGILRYEGVPVTTDADLLLLRDQNSSQNASNPNPRGCYDMPFDAPRPRRAEAAVELATADPRFVVDFEFRQAGEVNRIFLNRTSWAAYRDDATLWQAVEQDFVPGAGGSYNNWGFRLDQQVLLVPDGSGAVQLAINSLDIMEHPFHMQ